ncbi:NSP1 [Rotavirus L]|nr:NSP1 [Rotavirus L]
MEIVLRGRQYYSWWSGKEQNLNELRFGTGKPMDVIPIYPDALDDAYSEKNKEMVKMEKGLKTNPEKIIFMPVEHSRFVDHIQVSGDKMLKYILSDICNIRSQHYCGAMHLVKDNRPDTCHVGRPQVCSIGNIKVPCGVTKFDVYSEEWRETVMTVTGTKFIKCICSDRVMVEARVDTDSRNLVCSLPIISLCLRDHLTIIINETVERRCKICGCEINKIEAGRGFEGGLIGLNFVPKSRLCLMCNPWRETLKDVKRKGYKLVPNTYYTEQYRRYLEPTVRHTINMSLQEELMNEYNRFVDFTPMKFILYEILVTAGCRRSDLSILI